MGIISAFAEWLGRSALESVADNIRIEAMEDDYTIVCKDGSLMTMIDLHGMLSTPGEQEMIEMAASMRVGLGTFFDKVGHAMTVTYTRDPASGRRSIERLAERTQRVAHLLKLDVDDVLSERIAVLSNHIAEENTILCLYSRPTLMGSEERKMDVEERALRRKGAPLMMNAQRRSDLDNLMIRHGSFVTAVAKRLVQTRQMINILNVSQAVREMRLQISPFDRSELGTWRPRLPDWAGIDMDGQGKRKKEKSPIVRAPSRPEELAGRDFSSFGVQTFDRQIVNEDAVLLDSRRVKMGDTVFTSFDMMVGQSELTAFNDLVASMAKQAPAAPWRATFMLESGGVAAMKVKSTFLTFFAMTNRTHNHRVRDALAMNREIDGKHDTIVKLRACFSTWGRDDDQRTLRRNAQVFQSAVREWGIVEIDGISGDPLATTIASMAGLTLASTAPVGAGPLTEVVATLPFGRQASPWQSGSVMLRTETGKFWPYQPGSGLQDTWINLIMGSPGKGKSVLMNVLNLGTILSPAVAGSRDTVLPKIVIIDIGGSSSGLISLVKESLPHDQRHLAAFRTLTMDRSDAINIFDTYLSMRYPTTFDKSFIVNFLSIVCSDVEGNGTHVESSMINMIVSEAYKKYSDQRTPKPYVPGDEPIVDEVLKQYDYVHDERHTWWRLVDFLVEKNQFHAATLAQRHAVPNLGDLATVATTSNQVLDLYRNVPAGPNTTENVIAVFGRRILETIDQYPILASHTRIDLGDARILSLDLMHVTTKIDTPQMNRQTSLMYMLARHATTRDFYMNWEEFARFGREGLLNAKMTQRHVEAARRNYETVKVVNYDEYHRTKNTPAVQAQTIQDCREGRKFKVIVNVASQHATDFDKTLYDFATGIFVCDAGEQSIDHMKSMLTPTDQRVMRESLTGPTSEGAPIWVFLKTKATQPCRQLLYLTLGPVELWAFSTKAEDVSVRNALYESLGPRRARQVLAHEYPGGSIENELAIRIKRAEEMGERAGDDMKNNIIGSIISDLEKAAGGRRVE